MNKKVKITLRITEHDHERLHKIGGGNVSAGIQQAIDAYIHKQTQEQAIICAECRKTLGYRPGLFSDS